MMLKSVLFIVLCSIIIIEGKLGVDISSSSTESDWKCLKGKGYELAVIRCWESIGQPDPNAAASVIGAWAGGMKYVDVYIFPCYSCGNGYGQVQSAIKDLQSKKAKFGTVWFDIEGPGIYWSSSQSDNQKFFEDMVSGAEKLGVSIGIYTSESQWVPIMGDYTGGSAYKLWYAHYDDNPSFSDFTPFGGWKSPHMKQWDDNGNDCGLGYDKNYFE
ncbi:glycoside hydrolase family 25 protein [Tieghemostelium lacteum]|uniref:lysozyme n=1 Tax=Tieghemostelium lacteum TaxID=361077 RepID=A0A151ZC02_TIELA|nr:glycoside hydrolase family 25 protein [Tieghemostelium lacteum]|eukprot:KYQ91476.1 glycoside hydrolase family 25 protein [Tieghemostelium lacteum]